jgi:glutamyl-tRNA synthetase
VAPRPIQPDAKAGKLLTSEIRERLANLTEPLSNLDDWDEEALETTLRSEAEKSGQKLGKVAQPLRAALTGSTTSPGLFEVMAVLGRAEVLARLADAATIEDTASHQK